MYDEMMDTIGLVGKADPELAAAMGRELTRQRENIELIASENIVSPAVMAAMGTVLTNKYAEGLPGKRYYGGCEKVDIVENLARERACKLYGAKFANVQPHSGANANLAAYFAGQTGGFSCSVAKNGVASASVDGKTLIVKGLAAGSTSLTVTAADGTSQTVVVTVRKSAGNNGWM